MKKMLVPWDDFWPAAVLLLPCFYARQIPENTNDINFPADNSVIILPHYSRQNNDPVVHSPQQQTSNFWNLLHTHGVGISATLGGNIRVASSDNHGTNDPNNTPRPSTNSVWDRYLGSTWHVGLNTHLGNNKQGQEGAAQHASGGSLPVVSQPSNDNKERIEKESTTTPKPTGSFWDRVSKYFSWQGWRGQNCEEACGASTTNVFGRIFARLFARKTFTESPTKLTEEPFLELVYNETVENETNESRTIFDKMRDRDADLKEWQNYESIRNTIKQFLADRLTSYVTQDSTNRDFLRTMLKRSILRITDGNEATKSYETDPAVWKSLSRYFTDEKIRALFPIVEFARKNITNRKITTDEEFNKWNNDYFESVVTK